MKNKKKKIGLIALFSCMFVSAIAFAAFNGQLTINGTANIVGNPFKVVFVDKDGTQANTIPAADATLNGAAEASALTVTDGTAISAFNVKLYKDGDSVTYSFKIKNTGGSPAYLSDVSIAATETDAYTGTEGSLTGLKYNLIISNSFVAESNNGEAISTTVSGNDGQHYITVAPDATVGCTLTVEAKTGSALFAGDKNVELTLGKIEINWTSVNPDPNAA